LEFDFDAGVNPVSAFFDQNSALLQEPTRRGRLEAEAAKFGHEYWPCLKGIRNWMVRKSFKAGRR
jgi:hypothetical protein